MRKRGMSSLTAALPVLPQSSARPPIRKSRSSRGRLPEEESLYLHVRESDGHQLLPEQLVEAGVEIGWNTRLVPFGPDISAAVFALGFANRAAMAFGGVKPGDFRTVLKYNKDRIFAFVNALGDVNAEWAANAAGAINWGFPTDIADTDIPEILPTGVCAYRRVSPAFPTNR